MLLSRVSWVTQIRDAGIDNRMIFGSSRQQLQSDASADLTARLMAVAGYVAANDACPMGSDEQLQIGRACVADTADEDGA